MSNGGTEMLEIFEALSEENRDILILVARGIKAVQDTEKDKKEEGKA